MQVSEDEVYGTKQGLQMYVRGKGVGKERVSVENMHKTKDQEARSGKHYFDALKEATS